LKLVWAETHLNQWLGTEMQTIILKEAEIGRIAVLGQSGQYDLISVEKELGVVVCTCHPSSSKKNKIGESWSRPT
jgi:hypothetical protein